MRFKATLMLLVGLLGTSLAEHSEGTPGVFGECNVTPPPAPPAPWAIQNLTEEQKTYIASAGEQGCTVDLTTGQPLTLTQAAAAQSPTDPSLPVILGRPGSLLLTTGSTAHCSTGFLHDSGSTLYFSTVAHCVDVGSTAIVHSPPNLATAVGTVTSEGSPGLSPPTSDDWALITISGPFHLAVTPMVYLIGGPVCAGGTIWINQDLKQVGYGTSSPAIPNFGQSRVVHAGWFEADLAAVTGDSGSPVLTIDPTLGSCGGGTAWGLVSKSLIGSFFVGDTGMVKVDRIPVPVATVGPNDQTISLGIDMALGVL